VIMLPRQSSSKLRGFRHRQGTTTPPPNWPDNEWHGPLLEVENLDVEFHTPKSIVHAVNNLSYSLHKGETLAILGESGSGKSVSAQTVMGILDSPPGFVTGGEIRYRGADLLRLTEEQQRQVRGRKIAIIFQDSLTALNPVFCVGDQIAEMFRVHNNTPRAEAKKQAVQLMKRVRIPSAQQRYNSYPHEFSGGMRQRVMIAIAIALAPEILIADEPTTALDVTVQAQIMDLLMELQKETGMGLMLITHDLSVVAEIADTIHVMYGGRIVEKGTVMEVYQHPAHPYTKGLLDSIPRVEEHHGGKLIPIRGAPPDMSALPSGCAFHPRCPHTQARCLTEAPALHAANEGRHSACHYWREILHAK